MNQEEHDAERGIIAGHIQAAIEAVKPGAMATSFVLIACTIDDDGEQTTSSWTAPDQRQWTTLGLMEFVKADHYAYLAKLRAQDDT